MARAHRRRPSHPPRRARPGITTPPSQASTVTALRDRPSGPFPVKLTHLTPEEVGRVLLGAGWPKDVAVVAKGIAIVEAESSGDWEATSANPDGGTNVGGWQIDLKAHPDVSESCAKDPECSSKWVWKTTHGRNYSIWATKDSSAEPFMDDARRAIAAGPIASGGTGLPSLPHIGNPLDSISQTVEAIAKFFTGLGELLLTPQGWIRIGKLLVGAFLVVWGLSKLAGRLGGGKVAKAGRSTASKIGSAAAAAAGPEGLAAKAAAGAAAA